MTEQNKKPVLKLMHPRCDEDLSDLILLDNHLDNIDLVFHDGDVSKLRLLGSPFLN